MDSRGGYILKILYVETKESGPLGGVRWARPLDLPMKCNININKSTHIELSSLLCENFQFASPYFFLNYRPMM